MAKNELEKEYRKYGYTKEQGFLQLAFVLPNLSSSQASYLCINVCNNIVEKTAALNLSLFFCENSPPCVPIKIARFHLRDACIYTGHLIAIDQETLNAISNFTRAKRYFYIQDLTWLTDSRFYKKETMDLMKDDSIIKIAKCKDHKDYLLNKGYNIHPIIVEDFDIDAILSIVTNKKDNK